MYQIRKTICKGLRMLSRSSVFCPYLVAGLDLLEIVEAVDAFVGYFWAPPGQCFINCA